MRIFKSKHRFNWKYIFGEILLIFLGINLAIWFNNWNTTQQNQKTRQIVIEKIKDEISSNITELTVSYENTVLVREALNTFMPLFQGKSSKLEVPQEEMKNIRARFPGFYTVSDSTFLDNGKTLYTGGLSIQLELVELTDIAWETTKSLEVLNEFGYECLYELESMYSLQSRVQKEIDKSAEVLQHMDIKALLTILNFTEQLEKQLKSDYQEMLVNIENCR